MSIYARYINLMSLVEFNVISIYEMIFLNFFKKYLETVKNNLFK